MFTAESAESAEIKFKPNVKIQYRNQKKDF